MELIGCKVNMDRIDFRTDRIQCGETSEKQRMENERISPIGSIAYSPPNGYAGGRQSMTDAYKVQAILHCIGPPGR